MNIFRKFLSLALAVVLVLCMLPAAMAEGEAVQISMNTENTSVEIGDSVQLLVNLDANAGFSSMKLHLNYDKETFELTEVNLDDTCYYRAISDFNLEAGNIGWVGTSNVTVTGELCKVTFKALKATEAAEIGIEVAQLINKAKENVSYAAVAPVSVAIAEPVVLVPATSAAIEVEGYEDLSSGITMTVGKSAAITAALSPENTTDLLSLTSDNEAVAKIENGKLVAVAAGTATITAKAMIDGETERGVSASFTVTVEEEEKVINGLTAALYNAPAEVENGDQLVVDLMLQSDEEEETYNAFDITINYDAAKLEFVSAEFAETEEKNENQKHEVSDDGEGTLTVYGYGEAYNASASNALVRLTFEGVQNGIAKVSVGAAFANDRAEAVEKNIDNIAVSEKNDDSDIKVYQNYTITFEGATVTGGEKTLQYRTDDSDGLLYFSVDDTVTGYDVDTVTVKDDAATVEKGEGNNYVLSNITGDVTVQIALKKETYAVTFTGADEDLDDETARTATYLEDFRFTVNEESGFKYSVTAKINGNEFVVNGSDGSYLIAGEYVTGPITVEINKKSEATTETYDVKTFVNGEKFGDTVSVLKGAESCTFSYKTDKYVLDQVTIDGETVPEANITDTNGSVVINQKITGEVHILLLSKYAITLPDGVSGNDYAIHGKDYTFTLKVGYELVGVTIAGTTLTLTPDANGVYTIPGNKVTGAFTIETQEIEGYTAMVSDFVQWDEKTVKLVLVEEEQNTAKPLTYDGDEMFYSSEYAGYAYLVLLGEGDETLAPEAASEKVALSAAAAKKNAIAYVNDVNLSGASDINDAQLVYDIYTAHYDTIDAVGMEQLLSADVNGDTVADTLDIAQIINAKYGTASN